MKLFPARVVCFPAILLLLFLTVLTGTASAWTWIHAGVDSSSGVPGQYVSLKVDRNGRLHGSYYRFDANSEGNRNLKYTTNVSSTWTGPWQTVVVDGAASSGSYSSIALTRENIPHISYYESEFANLRHAWYDSTAGTWLKETVDSPGIVGQYSAMAIDTTSNTLYIAYFDASTPGLKVARKVPGGLWTFVLADQAGAVGLYNSMIVNGNVQIAYYDLTKRNLKFAEQIGGQWNVVTVDSIGDVGRYASIGGSPLETWISYYDLTNRSLKFAERVNGAWSVTTLDGSGDPGPGTTLSTGPASRPCIAYYAAQDQDLRYAERFNGTWLYSTIATGGNVGRYCSMVTSSSDLPGVLYFDESQSKLRFARGTGSTTGTPEPSPGLPEETMVLRVRNNPARSPVLFEVETRLAGLMTLRLFDVSGRRIRDLHDGRMEPGIHSFNWNGVDELGRPAPSGVYFVASRSREAHDVVRFVLIR